MGNELGKLFYSLGVNDEEFAKKMNAAKRLLVEFERQSKSAMTLKLDLLTDNPALTKAMHEALKLANQKASADSKAAINAKRLAQAESAAARATKDRATAEQKLAAARVVSERAAGVAARREAIQSGQAARNALIEQRRLTELEKTSLAHLRLEKASKRAGDGQRHLAQNAMLANRTFMNQKVLLFQLSNMLGTAFSVYAIAAFVRQLMLVRGEFELQQVALRAIIQDKLAADRIFSQTKKLAVESPFQFKDLVTYTKQLAAFSIETDKLFETTKRLADVSAGLGVDMNRIVLAYGQIRAAAFLRGLVFLASHGRNTMLNTPLIAGTSFGTISSQALAA